MGFIESVEKTRFIGRHAGRDLEVTVDIFESPMRVWLAIDGVQGVRHDVPARFELGDGAVLTVDGRNLTVSECAIVDGDLRTGLELAPDSGVRRYVRWADTAPLAERIRYGVFFVAIPVLMLLALSGLLLAPFMAGPLEAIGIGQPDDLPWPTWSWLYGGLAGILLFGLGAEEDARKAWGRHLVPSRQRLVRGEPAALPEETADSPARYGSAAWEARLNEAGQALDRGWNAVASSRVSQRIEGGWESFTTSRFTGRHAGRTLEVVFDFFDDPTQARLIVDGTERDKKGVPARFDLGDGATLEAEATAYAVMECAVVTADQRVRLQPVDDHVARWHERFFARHPRVESIIGAVGAVVIAVAGFLGLIDLYNAAMTIGGRFGDRLLERFQDIERVPYLLDVIDWLPDSIDLPIALSWWQAALVIVIPMLFTFDRDVRRSNRRFGAAQAGPVITADSVPRPK